MTNRLELNWKLDGFVDEQHYYCSEMPIDTNNLPTPKMIFAGDVRAYIDTAIEAGKTYYVRVSSIKNGVEKISDQIITYTQSAYISYIDFSNRLYDAADGVQWQQNGSIDLSDGLTLNLPQRVSGAGTNYIYRSLDLPSMFKIDVLFKYAHPSAGNGWAVPILQTADNSLARVVWESLYFQNTQVQTLAQNTETLLTYDFKESSVDIYVDNLFITTISYTHTSNMTLCIGDNGIGEWTGGTLVVKHLTISKTN